MKRSVWAFWGFFGSVFIFIISLNSSKLGNERCRARIFEIRRKFVCDEECTARADAKENSQRFAKNIFSNWIMQSVVEESIGYRVFTIQYSVYSIDYSVFEYRVVVLYSSRCRARVHIEVRIVAAACECAVCRMAESSKFRQNAYKYARRTYAASKI